MRKQKNIGVNAVLNVIKSGLSVIFPLITYPYAIRVLGAEGIGKVTYGNSIISYFALIAMLGVTTYAVREGSKCKDNKDEFVKFTNEVFTINIVFTVLAYVLLALGVTFASGFNDYKGLLFLQSISIILTTLGVDWINTVYEDFLFITIRSIIAHLLSLILLFIFVHKPEDYHLYALLTVTTNGLTCISNWFYCRKYAKVRITFHPNFSKHLKPLLILFVNAVAVSIYVNFDTTMLGWIKGDYYVGLYAVPVRIYTIVKSVMVAVYTVAIPRLAFYIGKNELDEYKKLYSEIWGYLALLLIPAGIGLICISEEIMLFMGGSEYLNATFSLQILSASLVISIFGGLVTSCLNVTLGREKHNLMATIMSAGINCGLNLIFIPVFNHYGAALTTLVSEAIVFFFCLYRIPEKKQYIDFTKVKVTTAHALIGSAVICIYSYTIKIFVSNSIYRVCAIIPGAIILYAIILLIIKDKYILDIMEKVKKTWK